MKKKTMIILAAALSVMAVSCTKDSVPGIRVETTTKNLWFSLPEAPKEYGDYFVNIQAFQDKKAIVKYIHISGGKWYIYSTLVNEKGEDNGFIYSVQNNPNTPTSDTTVAYRDYNYAL